jgi:shikimate dehydrogenase
VPDRRLAVIGSPVAHSLSPVLHRAAYRALGLDWGYDRHEVRAGGLTAFVDGLDRHWRGLSVTMPLKEETAALADGADRTVELTGAANTLLLDGGRRIARNTDVAGVERALTDAGAADLEHAVIVGAGATARSVLVALDGLGLRGVTALVRDPARAVAFARLADELGLELDLVDIAELRHLVDGTDVVAWTLPNGVPLPSPLTLTDVPGAVALDVTYSPWPGPLAAPWLEAGGRVASGRDMLLHQAVRQVRFFVSGQTESPLPDEETIEAVMRAALPEAS